MMDDMDQYYEILGLELGASPEEVKQAYRDLVKVWHPDRFLHDSRLQQKAQEKLKEINEAYEQLRSFRAGSHNRSSQQRPNPRQPQSHPESTGTRSGGFHTSPRPHTPTEPPRQPSRTSRLPIWLVTLATLAFWSRLIFSQLSGPSKPTTSMPPEPPPVVSSPRPPSETQGMEAHPEDKTRPEDQVTLPPPVEAPAREKTTTKVEIPSVAIEPKKRRAAAPPKLPRGYFTVGSSQDEVLAIQGTPTSIIGDRWGYEFSSVDFYDGRVTSYSNISNNLKIRVHLKIRVP